MSYITENFLLETKTAQKLYSAYAKDMPIFDYHCHLPERQILENKQFENVAEVWLGGDHYKWRLMRNYGIDEEYITGKSTDKEKFFAYCKTLSTAFGNPLYHWSQVELQEFFECEKEINEENAEEIWNSCNEYIEKHHITPQTLIEKSNVKCLFTTNEVFDDLAVFKEIEKKGYSFKVYPAFRADKVMNIEAAQYNDFIARTEKCTHQIKTLAELENALNKRLEDFIAVGCKASDIALEKVYPISDRTHAAEVFAKRRNGEKISIEETEIFKGYLTYFLMQLYAKYHICTELHVGAMRNNNSIMLEKLGLDTGYDSISEENSIKNMSRLFDRLNTENALPKTIVFNLNPKMNAEIVTLNGCFQSSEAKGKMQYGAAWWFLDNKEGMEKHLKDLTATGHIGTFLGMLTDSRSFLSYPRHQYFRKILCNYLGEMMEKGLITANEKLVGKVIQDICFNNAAVYFGIDMP